MFDVHEQMTIAGRVLERLHGLQTANSEPYFL